MAQDSPADYYEALQISTSADPETIHRVYRFLAQRFHPDNKETGNAIRFRLLSEAHRILSDPEERARYDLVHTRQQQDRWRLVARGVESENDFGIEQSVRLTVLEVLYTRRRVEPYAPGLFGTDLEKMIGRPREHLEFTTWYLIQKNLIQRSDNSLLMITAEGIDHLEGHYRTNAPTGRLRAVNE
jgi:curved DNA-binding protein CbpA